MPTEIGEDGLESLRVEALDLARHSKTLADIEKAASIAKLLAESTKGRADVKNQPRILFFEQLKSWAAIIVPFLTLVTLAVTVGMQYSQLSATREANEDLKWRETVKLVLDRVAKKDAEDPIMATTLLKSYVRDPRYSKDAIDLGLLMLSRIPSTEVFKDFYLSMDIHLDWSNVDRILGINRNLNTEMGDLYAQTPQEIDNPDNPPKSENRSIYYALRDDDTFLGEKIADLLRTPRPAGYHLNLSRALFFTVDLSGANLGDSNLTEANFDRSTLKNARIDKVTQFKDSYWSGANWWEAEIISPELLLFLIDKWRPKNEFEYTVAPPEKSVYVAVVRQLCRKVQAKCPNDIPYEWQLKK